MLSSSSFIVEINGKAVGLLLKEANGFSFAATEKNAWHLNSSHYRSVREALIAVKRGVEVGHA